jgi:type IV pilus assembly protein PilB
MPAFSNNVAEKVLRVLQSANRLDPQKLTEVRKAGASSNADILERMIRGKTIDEGLVHQVLSKAYSLRRMQLAPADVDQRALKLVPARLVDENRALPFAVDQRFLRVGIVDPGTAAQASQFKSASNLNIEFQLITLSNFEALRQDQKVKSALEATNEAPKKQQPRPATKPRRLRFALDNEELVPEVCDHILHAALQSGTSDIHIEPFRDIARVRFRIDGRLEVQEEYSEYLLRHYLGVVTRFKIMADCDISEKRLPQDGGITIKYKNEDIDFRFNVLPGKNGERIVMRILKGDPSLSLTKLGFSEVNYNNIVAAINAPQGMVLVTGPTGSGKTTTLYGCLQHINEPELNIMTAEDPVEYYLEGVGQTQANEKIGLTFNSILRAFLRQDPEVILVGEIRDQETVEIAVKAALTGHLLLSTLHTNDAIATITRLMNMGVPPFMIAAATSLIVAQRLGRPNCQNCLIDDPHATPESLRRLGFSEEEVQTIRPMIGGGCDVCGGSGYKGRRGVYEVLRITPALEEAILKEALAPELLAAAKLDGFETMQEIARGFIKDGIFNIAEYTRILVL